MKASEPTAAEGVVDGRRLRRQKTEARLVQVLGEILRESGVGGLGINAIAERSGVEKVLVYRYFGGLEGLMEAYAARSDFWPSLVEIIGDGAVLQDPDPAVAAARVLVGYAKALLRRPVTVELLGWECAHRNALTIALEEVRTARTTELFDAMTAAGLPLGQGAGALGAILGGAINYLLVRGRHLPTWSGVPVHTADDWAALEPMFVGAFRGLMAVPAPAPAAKPTRKRAARKQA